MLRLYQGNRLEYLADLLIEITADPVPAPLQAETVVVPHSGMARWLSLQIAERSGICANYRFPQPAAFIWDTLNRLLPGSAGQDLYAPGVMQWSLFGLLQQLAGEDLFAPVAGYLDENGEQGRYELAAEIAACFDQYLVYRPDWIRAWEAGREAVEGDAWQAELWRRLRRRTRAPHWVDLQHRLQHVLESAPVLSGRLPGRIAIFGVPTLSSGYLAVLTQLSEWMEVHLFLLNPCADHWSGIVDPLERSARELDDPSTALYLEGGNPLLASLGRQGRDFFSALLDQEIPTIDLFGVPDAGSLLDMLQEDLLRLRDSTQAPPRQVAAEDESFQLHCCHTPMREVEVLHDQLLNLFDREHDLAPHQVVVMMPDLKGYAPYIDAVFGADRDHRLPYSIATHSRGGSDTEVNAFLRLLELPDGRFQSDELLALLEVTSIRRRFDIEESDLGTIRQWVEESGVRWGIDSNSRRELGLPETEQNSWRAGLDRMLLGYALPGDGLHLFEQVLPYDRIEGAGAKLLGNLTTYVQSLFELCRLLGGRHRLLSWSRNLQQLLTMLFQPDEGEEQPLQRIRDAIAEMVQQAEWAGFDGPVPLNLVRGRLTEALMAGSESGGLLTGGVSFCGLTTLRSLPFEVVCLIGMNDTSFPAHARTLGFDLMARRFRPGDRPRRVDDRYLFLETLIAARRCLYISYTGQDVRDNSSLPPSVLVTELLDYLDRAFRYDDVSPAARWPLRHPLQPFSMQYFGTGGRLFSYRTEMALAAGANRTGGCPPPLFLPQPLTPPEADWRSLDPAQLCSFYANPTRYLLRERMGLQFTPDERVAEIRDPFEIGYFDQERLGRQLIRLQLEREPDVDLIAVERAAGRLPHATAGERQLESLRLRADAMAGVLHEWGIHQQPDRLPLDLRIGEFRIAGVLGSVTPAGIAGYSFNPLPAGKLLALWIEHLLLNLCGQEQVNLETRWLNGGTPIRFGPSGNARRLLEDLLGLYWQGLISPLHLFPRSSREYVEQLQAGRDAEAALAKARLKWTGGFVTSAEYDNPYYRQAFPGADVLDEAFMQQSERVFGPLLEALEVAS